MHIVLLKFGPNKQNAAEFMSEHNAWIAKGFSDGIFQCTGSLDVGGGVILAHSEDTERLKTRVNEDPFVQHEIVTVEIHEIDVKRTSKELEFLASSYVRSGGFRS